MFYQRFVQWASGPIAVAIGYFATKIVHVNISHSAALNTATFIASALVVYAGHHKWLDNLSEWWTETTVLKSIDQKKSIGQKNPGETID